METMKIYGLGNNDQGERTIFLVCSCGDSSAPPQTFKGERGRYTCQPFCCKKCGVLVSGKTMQKALKKRWDEDEASRVSGGFPGMGRISEFEADK